MTSNAQAPKAAPEATALVARNLGAGARVRRGAKAPAEATRSKGSASRERAITSPGRRAGGSAAGGDGGAKVESGISGFVPSRKGKRAEEREQREVRAAARSERAVRRRGRPGADAVGAAPPAVEEVAL